MSRAAAVALAAAVWVGTARPGPWWLCLAAPLVLPWLWRRRGGRAARRATPYCADGRPDEAGAPRRELLAVLIVVAACGASGLAGGRTGMRDADWLAELGRRPQPYTVVVVTEPRHGRYDAWAIVRISRVGTTRVRVRALLRGRPPPLGTTVHFVGVLRPLGDEPFDAYLRALGAGTQVLPRSAVRVTAGPGWLLRATGALRDRLHDVAHGVLGPDRGSVLTGLVTGDDRGRPPALQDELERAGLAHLVVVSGRHTALFLGAVLAAGRLTRRGFRTSRIVALVALGGFVVLVRWEPSVLRAGAVAAVILAADLAGRDRDHPHLLAMVVTLLLVTDPLLGRRLGFLLSVSATAGVLVVAPVLWDRLRGPPWLRASLGVTIAAQLAVAPALVAGGHDLPVGGVVANLFAAPAAALAQALGGLAALLVVPAPGAARMVVQLGAAPLDAILWSARTANALVPGGPPSGGRLLVAAVVVLGGVLVRRTGRRRLATLFAAAAVAMLVAPPPPAADVDALTVTTLDVGQGDAVLVSSPGPGGTARMLVDAGPDARAAAELLRQRGVRRLHALVVSHPHADHLAGAAQVLRRLRVGNVLVGPGSLEADEPGVRELLMAARDAGVPVLEIHAGQRFDIGGADVRVLWPPPRVGGLSVNDRSLVLRVDGRVGSALLTGDVEATGQRALLARPGDIDVDVLKVPHHGGATNADGFLAATTPAVAVLSVGGDNDYGHPAPSVLQDLADVHTVRTDLDGSVTVELGDDGARVTTGHAGRRR